MMRVLVTGASGFIGRAALSAIESQGAEIHTAGRQTVAAAGITHHSLDLLAATADDLEALLASIRPTHLLHLAWIATPGTYWTAPENAAWAEATARLGAAFVEAGGRRIVAAGSCLEYAPSSVPIDETQPVAASAPYTAAKDRARRSLEELASDANVSLAWARPFFLYGPGESRQRLVASVITSLLAGDEALCSDGRSVRDFLHVADVGNAFASIVSSDITGAVNICSGGGIAVRDVILRIAAMMGRPDGVRLGALPSREETPVIVGVNERLRSTGWRQQFTLDAGLSDTIEWWRSRQR